MKINPTYKDIIVREIDFVLEKMKQTEDAGERLYFFSGVSGILQRIFNLEYNEDVVFAHLVLRHACDAFMARLGALRENRDLAVKVTDDHLDKLSKLTKRFRTDIAQDRDTYVTLRSFVILAYSTTGNGRYLQEKGLLKI